MKEFILTAGKQGKRELVSITDNFKRTALHLAVKEGFDVLAEYLVVEGFSLTARDRELKTPLHYCKSELVGQLLLKKGANVALKDNKYGIDNLGTVQWPTMPLRDASRKCWKWC